MSSTTSNYIFIYARYPIKIDGVSSDTLTVSNSPKDILYRYIREVCENPLDSIHTSLLDAFIGRLLKLEDFDMFQYVFSHHIALRNWLEQAKNFESFLVTFITCYMYHRNGNDHIHIPMTLTTYGWIPEIDKIVDVALNLSYTDLHNNVIDFLIKLGNDFGHDFSTMYRLLDVAIRFRTISLVMFLLLVNPKMIREVQIFLLEDTVEHTHMILELISTGYLDLLLENIDDIIQNDNSVCLKLILDAKPEAYNKDILLKVAQEQAFKTFKYLVENREDFLDRDDKDTIFFESFSDHRGLRMYDNLEKYIVKTYIEKGFWSPSLDIWVKYLDTQKTHCPSDRCCFSTKTCLLYGDLPDSILIDRLVHLCKTTNTSSVNVRKMSREVHAQHFPCINALCDVLEKRSSNYIQEVLLRLIDELNIPTDNSFCPTDTDSLVAQFIIHGVRHNLRTEFIPFLLRISLRVLDYLLDFLSNCTFSELIDLHTNREVFFEDTLEWDVLYEKTMETKTPKTLSDMVYEKVIDALRKLY